MKLQNKDFKKWIAWAMESPLRKQTMLHLLDQWEREEVERQHPAREFNTNFNAVRTALETRNGKET